MPGLNWARTMAQVWVLGCCGFPGNVFLFLAEKLELFEGYDSFYSVGNMVQLA